MLTCCLLSVCLCVCVRVRACACTCTCVRACVRVCCQLVNARCTAADKDQKDITNNRLQTGERDTQVLPRKSPPPRLTHPPPLSKPPPPTPSPPTHQHLPPPSRHRGGHSIASHQGCAQVACASLYFSLKIATQNTGAFKGSFSPS